MQMRESNVMRRLFGSVALGAALLLGSAGASAQEPPQQPPAQEKQTPDSATTFQAAGDGEALKENLPAWPFLYGAYFAILVLLMLYISTLWLRQRRIDGEIARLDGKLDRIEETLSAGGSRGA